MQHSTTVTMGSGFQRQAVAPNDRYGPPPSLQTRVGGAASDIAILSLVIVKQGVMMRKFFNLNKEDDVRKYAVR
jgi:hypothetical protein